MVNWRRLPRPAQKAYAVLVLGGLLIRIPFWALWYLIPATRPKKNIPVSKCLVLKIVKTVFTLSGSCVLPPSP